MSQIIGPRRALSWIQQFANQAEYGTGNAAFRSGAGSFFPMPSVSLAQASRYWWAAKEWRLQFSVDPGSGVETFDSGWIPYGTGFNANTSAILQRGPPGNELVAPTTLDRYLWQPGASDFATLSVLGGPSNSFFDINGFQNIMGIMGQAETLFVGGPGPGSPDIMSLAGLVWDDTTPGNVFMSFALSLPGLTLFSFSLLPPSAFLPSTATCSFDGTPITLYGNAGATGTVTITTKDT